METKNTQNHKNRRLSLTESLHMLSSINLNFARKIIPFPIIIRVISKSFAWDLQVSPGLCKILRGSHENFVCDIDISFHKL